MGGVVDWIGDALGNLLETGKEGIHQFFIKPIEWGMDQLTPDFDVPEYDQSPTYGSNQIRNTISEGVPVARCYGRCKIGVNKIRFNAKDASDLRIIYGVCVGEIDHISTWFINDISSGDLKAGVFSHTSYEGTRTQTPDARFTDRPSAYRGMAYVAATFTKEDSQVGSDPHLTVYLDALKCAPLAGGAKAFTRNPAVVLYDWYTEVEGYSSGDINTNSFKSLEALCTAVPTGGSLPRYRFDFSFDINININDAKKTIWQSFNGRVIMSQGELKAVWDSAQMEDGAGGLTAKTVSHAFTEDNIVKGSLTWHQPERPNIVRVHYLDWTEKFKKTSVEVKDEHDISINGEILYEEKCWFIIHAEIARRRAQYKFNKFKYTDYTASLSALSGAGDLEVYDKVTITDSLPGWTAKEFLVTQKGEDQYGRMQFVLDAYYAGIYDDSEAGEQPGYEPDLPNPYEVPYEIAVGDITLAEVSSETFHWSPAVNVTFTEPTTDPFWSHVEVWISTDDATFTFYGITSDGTGFTIETTGAMFQPGATLYVKLLSVSESGVKDSLTNITSKSIVLSSVIRLGNFYVHANSFGNAAIEANATILLDSANTWIRVGASGSDHVLIDGDYSGVPAIRSSNYVSGAAGEGFLLKSDLLEVGNIACRGIFRTAVFQKDIVSAIGGNVFISKGADVLDADMTAVDITGKYGTALYGRDVYGGGYYSLTIEGNETFAVNDILRIKDGSDDEWFRVANIDSAPIYHVERDKGTDYGLDANPAWKKGATVVNYGQSGDGAIYLTASETNAPYIGVITHTGSPWASVTTRLRIGNLNGFLGYSSDLYGIAFGVTGASIVSDPTNGLVISGPDITMQAGRTLTLSGATINMTAGTFTVSATGKIAINTTDALEIQASGNVKVLAGGDIVMAGSDTNPGNIQWGTGIFLGARAAPRLCLWPDTAGQRQFSIGWDAANDAEKLLHTMDIRVKYNILNKVYYSATFYSEIDMNASATVGRIDLTVRAHASDVGRSIRFEGGAAGSVSFGPLSNKVIDCGLAGAAWDDVWADDYQDEADFFHLDEYNDLEAIKAIQKSKNIDPRTGLPLIDDDTIPTWMLTRSKDGKEIVYSPDGKPYLSLKLMISLLMGATKQLDAKIEKITNP